MRPEKHLWPTASASGRDENKARQGNLAAFLFFFGF
jgi:hypothetical protein